MTLPNKILDPAKEGDDDDSAENAEMNRKIETVKSFDSYSDCVEFAGSVFRLLFNENIEKLLKEHPDDTEEGSSYCLIQFRFRSLSLLLVLGMFWAPPKYKPKTVEFNPDSTTHDTFVKSFSSILATVLGVNSDSDPDPSSCKKKPKTLEGAEEHNPSKRVCHMHHIQSRNTSTSFGPPRASMCRKLWQSAPLHQREENGLPGKSYLPSRQQRLLSRVL